MRRLVKEPEPDVLRRSVTRWTEEYLTAIDDNRKPPSRWRHPEIRATLENEVSRRCAYCDSIMVAVTAGHIEHILPRSKRPELVLQWTNLTIACPRCNLAKSDYFSEELPLLNPYIDNPAEHLVFVGDLVFSRPESDRGAITVLKLGLSRAGLVAQRKARLEQVASLVKDWVRAKGELREAIAQLIYDDLLDGPYQRSVESLLGMMSFPPAQVGAYQRRGTVDELPLTADATGRRT